MYNIVPYMISQYPTHYVGLLHMKLQDGGVEFDAFVEICTEQGAPVVPSAIFVDDGFFLQVCVPTWQYFNGACNYYHDCISVYMYCMLDITCLMTYVTIFLHLHMRIMFPGPGEVAPGPVYC